MRPYPSPPPVTDTRVLKVSCPACRKYGVTSTFGFRSQLVDSSQRPGVSGGKLPSGPDLGPADPHLHVVIPFRVVQHGAGNGVRVNDLHRHGRLKDRTAPAVVVIAYFSDPHLHTSDTAGTNVERTGHVPQDA